MLIILHDAVQITCHWPSYIIVPGYHALYSGGISLTITLVLKPIRRVSCTMSCDCIMAVYDTSYKLVYNNIYRQQLVLTVNSLCLRGTNHHKLYCNNCCQQLVVTVKTL